MLTANKLSRDYYEGIRNLRDRQHPCSVCESGKKFAEHPHFHGSDFGRCNRQVQWEKLAAKPDDFHPEKAAMFRDGHVHEAAVVASLRAAGYKVTNRDGDDEFRAVIGLDNDTVYLYEPDEPMIHPDTGGRNLEIVAHTDGVINGKYLLECKAVKDASYRDFMKGKLPANYLGQMKLYMTCLDLECGFLAVKSRQHSTVLFFRVARDDEYVMNKARDLWTVQQQIVTRETAPASFSWVPCEPLDANQQRWCDACKIIGDKR